MCGLFAVVPLGSLNRRKREQLRQLFLWLGALNDARGGHSWGVWGRDAKIQKGLGCFTNNIKGLNKMVRSWRCEQGSWMAGHTRFGTHGKNTIPNAHPFKHDNLTLAHNGVLDVYAKVEGKIPEVDSAHLALYLSQQLKANKDKSFEEVFTDSIGAAAGSIGLLMSDEVGNLRAYASCQELHYAVASWGYAVSSSKFHLANALEAAGLDYESITPVPEDTLIAPWYSGYEEVYAPAMLYRKAHTPRKTWMDYRKADTLTHFNSFYAGAESGNTPLGVHDLSADYPTEDYSAQLFGGDLARPGDWDALESSTCELCSSRSVGYNPAVWTDPDSGRNYLCCPDCAKMFIEAADSHLPELNASDLDIIEAEMEELDRAPMLS